MRCNQGADPNIAVAELDLDYVASVRVRMPVASHQRTADTYSRPVGTGLGGSEQDGAGAGAGAGSGAGAGCGAKGVVDMDTEST